MAFDPGWDDPSDAAFSWRRVSGPCTRLYEDAQRAYYRALRRCWELCASPMSQEHITLFVDGWVYRRGAEMDGAAHERLARQQEHAASVFDRGRHYYSDEIRPQVVEIIERLRRHPRPTRPLDELVAHLEECVEAQAHIMGDLHWRMAAGMVRPDAQEPSFAWPGIYAEITGRPASEAAVLLGGLRNSMTKTIGRLRRLGRVAASDPELLEVVERGDATALDDDRPAFRRFRTGFRALLRRYGYRTGQGFGSSVAFGAPTWNISPQIPLSLVATYARSDPDALDRKEREAARARRRLAREVRRDLRGDPKGLERFEAELRRATTMAYVLEDHNDWMDQWAPGMLRDAAHVVGQRLVRDGVIDDPLDVVHLSLAELRSPPPDARALVDERKRELERRQREVPPEHMGQGPPSEGIELTDEGEGHVGDGVLRGIAASPGRYTGRARVFLPGPLPPDVGEGDILVAVDAGPDWTPVFAVLGGVVLDRGAAWQHAAVVAREFAIPAVTGTKHGTTVITDGQKIVVDGDSGVVELL